MGHETSFSICRCGSLLPTKNIYHLAKHEMLRRFGFPLLYICSLLMDDFPISLGHLQTLPTLSASHHRQHYPNQHQCHGPAFIMFTIYTHAHTDTRNIYECMCPLLRAIPFICCTCIRPMFHMYTGEYGFYFLVFFGFVWLGLLYTRFACVFGFVADSCLPIWITVLFFIAEHCNLCTNFPTASTAAISVTNAMRRKCREKKKLHSFCPKKA